MWAARSLLPASLWPCILRNDTHRVPLGILPPGSSIWHPACRQAARTEDKNKVGPCPIRYFLRCILHPRCHCLQLRGCWPASAGSVATGTPCVPQGHPVCHRDPACHRDLGKGTLGRGGRALWRTRLPCVPRAGPDAPTASGAGRAAAVSVDARPGRGRERPSVPPLIHGLVFPDFKTTPVALLRVPLKAPVQAWDSCRFPRSRSIPETPASGTGGRSPAHGRSPCKPRAWGRGAREGLPQGAAGQGGCPGVRAAVGAGEKGPLPAGEGPGAPGLLLGHPKCPLRLRWHIRGDSWRASLRTEGLMAVWKHARDQGSPAAWERTRWTLVAGPTGDTTTWAEFPEL